MLFFFIALLAGVLTVLAPCILPLLPVVIGGSVSGGSNPRRAFTVVASLGISVVAFTLLLKASTAFINVPPLFWQLLSGGLLLAFGLVTLFPKLWDALALTAMLNRSAQRSVSRGFMKQSFWGDVMVGAALGPVFTSCSPTYFIVLATILPAHPVEGFVYLLAYALGLTASLALVAILGQRIMSALGVAADSGGWFKKAIGILFIIVGLAVLFGFDKQLAANLPAGAYGISGIEQMLLEKTQGMDKPAQGEQQTVAAPSYTQEQKARMFPKAPELVSPDAYLNTNGEPITISQFKGKKVVLIDFWTYSCINCQRTLPYLKTWYSKYEKDGLVIIGVHTPEFAFEHVQANVEAALKQFGITYPVVLDNEYKTWNAFGNQFWPRKYLIDINGYIVYDHAGEGNYDETERAIQAALAERAQRLGEAGIEAGTTSPSEADLSGIGSPETYFGASRNDYLSNGAAGKIGTQTLTLPSLTLKNSLYLGGTWDFSPEYATAGEGSEVVYPYSAKDVYLVASASAGAQIEVWQDGKLVSTEAGADVLNGTATIKESRLYKLVHNASGGAHTLRLVVKKGTIDFYTFTFG